jgi:manganese/zinc/iron transport system substrate-binding protein
MVADIVRHVAAGHAEVVGLIGTGVDPHLYKPLRHDIQELHSAEVVFYNGLLLEGRMSDALARVARSGKPVFAVTEALQESYLREPPEFQGHYDPHVWMDVAAWRQCMEFVGQVLANYDPAHADDYRRNAAEYSRQLQALDEYVRRVIGSIPPQQRVLVTAHDAFGYFARAYGLEVRSAQGISTESEAGVQDIVALVDFIVERKVPAIFVESTVNPKNIRAVIDGAARRGHAVRIGGELFSDAMGEPGTYEGTYVGMMDHNATVIARALGGTAPPGGFQGRLQLAAESQP